MVGVVLIVEREAEEGSSGASAVDDAEDAATDEYDAGEPAPKMMEPDNGGPGAEDSEAVGTGMLVCIEMHPDPHTPLHHNAFLSVWLQQHVGHIVCRAMSLGEHVCM